MEPTPANRWQALRLFRRWAETDAEGALRVLSGPEKSGESIASTLWPDLEARRQFWMILAHVTPDQAWRLAGKSNDPAAVNAVATALAANFPEKVLDSAADESVKLLAKAARPEVETRLRDEASDETRALQMHRLLSLPLTPALVSEAYELIGGSEELDHVLAWRSEFAGRLLERDRQEVLRALQTEGSSHTKTDLAIAFTATLPPGGLDEVLSGKTDRPSGIDAPVFAPEFFPGILKRWDTDFLTSAVSRFLPLTLENPDEAGEGQRIQNGIIGELLARDPATLLPVMRELPREVDFGKIGQLAGGSPLLTKENALSARRLVETAPESARLFLMDRLTPLISEFDPDFVAEQILRSGPMAPSGSTAAPDADAPGGAEWKESFAAAWMQKDPFPATQWVLMNPEVLTAPIFEYAIHRWALTDPEACSGWLTTLPAGAQKDAAVAGLVAALQQRDPGAALAWTMEIRDSENRLEKQRQILSDWESYAPEAAAEARAQLNP